MAGIQCCEVVGVHKFMGNFLHSGCLVIIMADGLVEVMGDLNTDVACHLLSGCRWLMTPSPWAGPHGWSLPCITFCWDAPWPLDVRRWHISWRHVWWDGHQDRTQIVYSPGNLPIPVDWSGDSLIKSSVDLMGLAPAGAAVGLTTVALGTDAGFGSFCVRLDNCDSTIHLDNC